MTRLTFPLKLLLMAAADVAVVAIVIASPTLIVPDWSAREVIGAQSSFALLLLPNVLTFVAFAILSRQHWLAVRAPQILVVSIICALITVVLMFAISFLLSPLLGVSTIAASFVVKLAKPP